MLQRLDGLDVERLKEIDSYATSPAFTDDERAAIAYADAMTTDPHTVTDEQVADLRARFGDAGVIELTYQIGLENMRARVNAALGITEQGFNSGDACRIPGLASLPSQLTQRRAGELVGVGDIPYGADLSVAHRHGRDPRRHRPDARRCPGSPPCRRPVRR